MACAGCGGHASLTFTGTRWLCDPCWQEAFGSAPPVNGVRA